MLKSLPSNDAAYISIINESSKTADIIWFDFEGKMVKYGTLAPGATQDINTYSQHPWKSFDSATGNEMLLNGSPVHYPKSVREIHQRLRLVRVPIRSLRCARSQVMITAPFGSLLELCKQFILSSIKVLCDIDQLEIPEILKAQLRNMLNKKEAYREMLRPFP